MITKTINNSELDLYIRMLTNNFGYSYSNKELKRDIKHYFNCDVDLETISNYFEPSVEELELDLRQQMKNIGMRYE